MTLDGHLSLAPLNREPDHVLDIGTGTGVWAIDYGDHPALYGPYQDY
jgi:ubiquinone/menaquinone biosynthesis C-methylase UbiE